MDVPGESESCRRGVWRASLAVRCALLLAVCALLASLAALATVLVRRAQEPPRALQPPMPPTPVPSGSEKSQHGKNCTRLVFKISEGTTRLRNRQLNWWDCKVDGTICSSIFEYNSSRLGIKYDGLYSIYAQMNISHQLANVKEKVNISLIIHGHRDGHSFRILTLPLSYPATAHTKETAVTVFMDVSSYQLKENDKLSAELMASNKYKSWTLSPKGNFFGISQVPAEPISEETGIKCRSSVCGMEKGAQELSDNA
ncbi:XP_034953137.1uncharacterized protein LOC118075335 [Podarcis lilfordi]|uniref:XP_034953137.1uncharacterized protein LOC118075335 n=1 Tax=Podarcis lilfordi TaxID=74358 RepID=A0AA35LHN3_9SAUR|nr:XP_034953137.1uncharacterized protein LOC118075335 [Podarcis lilfordi]